MIENSHATKNPLRPTSPAIAASFPMITPGGSQCVSGASARNRKIDIVIAVSLFVSSRSVWLRKSAARQAAKRRLPAGFRHSGDQPLRSELAEREPRDLETPNERATASRHLTTVHHACRAGVARKLRQ